MMPDHVSLGMKCGLETTCKFSRIWGVVYECPEPYYWVLRMFIKCACAPSLFCDWFPISGENLVQ